MNVWQAVWQLVRFAPWLFVANALIWIVEDFFYLAPGLVLRQIFDTLTDHAQLNVGFWALLAFIPALSGLQTLLVVGGTATGATFHGTVGALLRKNLFARILRRPGGGHFLGPQARQSAASVVMLLRSPASRKMSLTPSGILRLLLLPW